MAKAKEKISLNDIRASLEGCRKCELCEGRTNIVFGEGDPDARVMIIGEAPGKNEDLEGRPFVGAAGKQLDRLLGLAGLDRSEVFIANVLKCRPPGNRDPKVEEIEMCADYLRDQTRAIDPEFMITLGNFASRFILKSEEGITSLRGKVYKRGKYKVFPVFHPAAALYDRSKMAVLEDDFKALGSLLNDPSDANDAVKEVR